MYTEEELLEAVDILVEDYGYDEDDAIDMIMESYEEELYNEGVLNHSKIPASITYNRLMNAHNKYDRYASQGKGKKVEREKRRINKLDDRLRRQVGEYNDYQNKRYIKYTSRGKQPKRYSQITLIDKK